MILRYAEIQTKILMFGEVEALESFFLDCKLNDS